jgi:hypothetical protein
MYPEQEALLKGMIIGSSLTASVIALLLVSIPW